ncbi:MULTISPECIES: tRNA (adenosine(37)-N6)-dimethylallyltransferase MiaA [Prochlorococcus]|uniref:tRNA (adenosine(37)-N6)-dimethylallyltransferase MiaA n=1 Tax=Prochlorococcus TaxID=1218 RepID=UPI0007B38124|nr:MULTISPECIES: tRNA (adenosine(37)-N6)-dimethylallyltransferase MiaA [Prochlorococcus]KZR66192.1 tRNA dimethylallyltransferase [Prochlorococcus marinus str. MIT 1312]KZR83024.1 tRNA dimethylallyltransferase [Prochlorococcus marinus str. MIT 1327]NMO83965.1 tRNA (adenosine(37)-N6)-dimethylallyltransferase MiaA [Prochlorococcus sp. P1344]NMP05495.1 tRNA (adenosine(37)-N6)-dimethylallyltransferase MiaA [Prochlorococcus sp. P1361]NMP13073.1 tRNA (adenosine(37)-N6)-dimethylallyltransferase MiaA [
MADESESNQLERPADLPLVVVVLGPTASGKTALGISLARHLKLDVLNVDSRQLYRDMSVGTAKPTPDQQRQVAHQLLDLRAPDQPITLKEFQSIAMAAVTQSIAQSRMALLVGGSGLYLKSLIKGLRPPGVAPQPGLRQQLQHLGQAICHPLLRQADPTAAKRIAPADSMRTQRALEVLYATGRPISAQQESIPPNWRVLELGLDPADLNERIELRTAQLYANGLIEETERLCSYYSADLPLLQTIGYREALHMLQGQLNLKQAIALTTLRTRQFAKRQRTWFRRQHAPHWLNGEEPLSEALSLIQAGLE